MDDVSNTLFDNTARELNYIADQIHEMNKKWWYDINTGEKLNRNVGEQLMLMVSELAEAMEADRKDLMDDKLPHRHGVEVELADCMIRIFDFAAGHGYDIGGALVEKCAYNSTRVDHSHEHRRSENGKKY